MTDLEVVKRDGRALEFVKNQTEDLCLAAVNKLAGRFFMLKKQTPKICLTAAKQNGRVLRYIKKNKLQKSSLLQLNNAVALSILLKKNSNFYLMKNLKALHLMKLKIKPRRCSYN